MDDFFVYSGPLPSEETVKGWGYGDIPSLGILHYEDGNMVTRENFAELVERRVELNESSYIEETSALLEELDLEPEDGLYLISKTLLDRIRTEAITTNRLKEKFKTNTLEFI
ncbi:hypothetical protein [Ralstonia phage RSP15]|uniref:hypothetical protein n=1 Tax=Ralstonia phage RSP15 TaxID=1785960 RepID=UPI00074D3B9A|nr:hypothetical protein BH754_gp213 [Ralstonia phage RSP15]BAU40093.1 hypothetical protein [Ralstonia phage RSP15]